MNRASKNAPARDAGLDQPTIFTFAIGGYMGDSFAVERDAAGVLYSCWEEGNSNRRDEHIDVRPEDWTKLRAALDAANVWAWRPKYEPTVLIMDGTGWHVAITWGDRSVESSGDNAYPTETGELSPEHDPGEAFESVLTAIQQLVGGRRFA